MEKEQKKPQSDGGGTNPPPQAEFHIGEFEPTEFLT